MAPLVTPFAERPELKGGRARTLTQQQVSVRPLEAAPVGELFRRAEHAVAVYFAGTLHDGDRRSPYAGVEYRAPTTDRSSARGAARDCRMRTADPTSFLCSGLVHCTQTFTEQAVMNFENL